MGHTLGGSTNNAADLEDHKTRQVMLPCPTHIHGHPTIVMKQFTSFGYDRHHHRLQGNNQLLATPSAQPQSSSHIYTSISREGQQHQQPLMAYDKSFDDDLWKLIPHSMRLQPASQSPQPARPQRPSPSDTIDNSRTRTLVSRIYRKGLALGCKFCLS